MLGLLLHGFIVADDQDSPPPKLELYPLPEVAPVDELMRHFRLFTVPIPPDVYVALGYKLAPYEYGKKPRWIDQAVYQTPLRCYKIARRTLPPKQP